MAKAAKRTFTVAGKKDGGRFTGSTPSAAARKAANKLLKKSGQGSMTITVRETTQGSDKKQFSYTARQQVLNPPDVVIIAGREVEISRKLTLKAKK